MATLYGTFPILLPGKTQSVSRNGLKKTSGTILCRPGQEADAYSMAQEYGSIFPDITTQTTDTGLIQVTFEAYQNNDSPTSVIGSLALTLTKSFNGTYTPNGRPIETTWTVIESWVVDTFTIFKAAPASANSFSIESGLPFLNRKRTQNRTIGRIGSGGRTELSITWLTEISNISRRNFGDIDETDITYSQTPTIT